MQSNGGETSAGDENNQPAASINYLVIGNLAQDLLPDGQTRLGGTVAYAALTAQALGYAPGLVTAYADDLEVSLLKGLARARTSSPHNTLFENIYGPEGRTQYLRAQAAPLPPTAIPPTWLAAPIIHLGPIAHEITTELLAALPRTAAVLGLTPQGWLRQWDAAGRVRLTPQAEALAALPPARAIVLSLEDLQQDWAATAYWAQKTEVLVITEGPAGCTVLQPHTPPQHFPAPAVAEVDPTGAGDIFAAAFFIALYETGQAGLAAPFANAIAAQSVTRPGLTGAPRAVEVQRHRSLLTAVQDLAA